VCVLANVVKGAKKLGERGGGKGGWVCVCACVCLLANVVKGAKKTR